MNILLPVLVFLEKIVAFVKQIIIAKCFGTSVYTDGYQMAENIVSIFRGAFSNSVPTVLLTKIVYLKNEKKSIEKLLTNAIGIFVLICAFVSCLLVFFSIMAVGSSELKTILRSFLIILSPTIMLGFLSSSLGAVLEAEKIYWPNKLSSLLTSVCVITSISILFSRVNIVSIFIGEIIALCIHIALMVFIIKRRSISFSKSIPSFDADVKKIAFDSLPIMISSSVYSINSLVDKTIATSLGEGVASVLQYARVLTLDLFPTIVITAFSGVMIREFSNLAYNKDSEAINTKVCIFMEAMIGFLGIVTIVSLINSNELISIAFKRGMFTDYSVSMTNAAFIGYAFGIPVLAIREITARIHYSFNDTRIPFYSSMVGVITNIMLSVILSKLYGIIGIAVATTCSITVTAVINIVLLRLRRGILFQGFFLELLKLLVPFTGSVLTCLICKSIINSYELICIFVSACLSCVWYLFFIKKSKARALEMYINLLKIRKE